MTPNSRPLALVHSVTLATLICLSGCDSDTIKTLDTGRIVPGFILRIELDEPISKRGLYNEFSRIARQEGYDEYMGREVSTSSINAESASFSWRRSSPVDQRYKFSIGWSERPGTETSVFQLNFYHKSMDNLGLAEWLMFRRWQTELLPLSFSTSHIEVVRHPAFFTAEENHQEYSLASGVSLPAD